MNYAEWNEKLAEHFFCKEANEQVFLCVTIDTLAEVSGMEPNAAREDFISAVLRGPEWTQIAGCQTVSSKAHNCLHPFPLWRTYQTTDMREKRTLTDHVHWKEFPDWQSEHPPYIAYLCLLVLSYTEREDVHGGQFYPPLNRLLGLEAGAEIECGDLSSTYIFEGEGLSINALWEDLESWSFGCEKGVCYLPDQKLWKNSYEFLPRFFGLFKAADLRSLDEVFDRLTRRGLVDEGNFPSPGDFAEKVLQLNRRARLLSQDCLKDLQDKDSAKRDALEAMLLSKFRQWDGTVGGQDADDIGRTCGARLLRFLSQRNLKAVVKLRSTTALRRLSVEAGFQYALSGLSDVVLEWPGNHSEWFKPFEFPASNRLHATAIECPELGLKAMMSARDLLVLSNQHLPFHLRGGYIEVDEIQVGVAYIVLTESDEPPQLGDLPFRLNKDRSILLPSGFSSAFRMIVPEDVDKTRWPSCLPPLANSPRDPRPKMRLDALCRVEPRREVFVAGFSLVVSSSHGDLEPFIVGVQNNCTAAICLRPRDGEWELIAPKPCFARLALREVGSQQIVAGTDRDVEFIGADDKLFDVSRLSSLFSGDSGFVPDYPHGEIQLSLEGKLIKRASGQEVYLGDNPPKVEFRATEGCQLFVDGHSFPTGGRLPVGRGLRQIELRFNGAILNTVRVELIGMPNLQVHGLSQNRQSPTLLTRRVRCPVLCSDFPNLNVKYEVVGSGGDVGEIAIPYPARIEPTSSGFREGQVYEVRFMLAGRHACSRWFKWQPSRSQVVDQRRPKRKSAEKKTFLGSLLDEALQKKGAR